MAKSEIDLRPLFQEFLKGDNTAFRELYAELNPRLSAYCYHAAPALAPEDLMQELWERVIALRSGKRAKTALVVDNPAAYIFRMLRNVMIDHLRSPEQTSELPADVEGPRDTEPTDIEALIIEAFAKLGSDDREVLALNIYSGYKFGEIASMLEVSVDSVWQRASRARTKLRDIVMADARRAGLSLPGKNKNTINQYEQVK